MQKIKEEHLKNLKEIIKRNWNYEDYNRSKKNSDLFSYLDLYDCLSRSNYSDFIIRDNKIVGFLLGHIKEIKGVDYSKYKNLVRNLESQLNKSNEGKIFLEYSDLYEKSNNSLYRLAQPKGDAEIILFALDPDYKRRGIGSILLKNYLDFLKENEIDNCYLYSDSTCDYQFYLNNRFERHYELRKPAELRRGETIHFYLFERKDD